MSGILYFIDDNGERKQVNLSTGTSGRYVEVTGLDPIVLETILDFIKRSRVGVKKYGTTLADNNTDDFFQHAKEEAMDFVNYLSKLQIQSKEK